MKKDHLSDHHIVARVNIIAYALAKFDLKVPELLGYKTYKSFYQKVEELGLVSSVHAMKNKRDHLDPFFTDKPKRRSGWHQNVDDNFERFSFLDTVLGCLSIGELASVVQGIITHCENIEKVGGVDS